VGVFSDVSKFVNKAVVSETTERVAPEHLFSEFAIDPRLKQNIVQKGYIQPTPIQDRVIPHALRGEDVVGVANTGTGKTAAFLIPLINRVLHSPREKALIVVPTRELAVQIEEEFAAFTRGLPLSAVVCIGGASLGKQIAELRRRHQFVVGTPGRLKDLVERRALALADFSTIVLDEADRMLDMGFIRDVRYLMAGLPSEHHTLFFSATVSRDIEHLIGTFMKQPVTISVKSRDTAATIEQDVVRIPHGSTKLEVLVELLQTSGYDRVLVFGRTKHGVERVSRALKQRGVNAESIHGNKSFPQRSRALAKFKKGEVTVLVATDVAARGLDIDDVSHVINFDLPATYEDYIHRIGRTGRAEKGGNALTFIE
jgi:superfamily II DNA/RNA helicase